MIDVIDHDMMFDRENQEMSYYDDLDDDDLKANERSHVYLPTYLYNTISLPTHLIRI